MKTYFAILPITAGILNATILIIIIAGCGQSSRKSSAVSGASTEANTTPAAVAPTIASSAPVVSSEDHAHKPGANGGIIVPIGRDSYHAEAVFEKQGALRLYMLGKDEGRVQEVERQSLTAYVKPLGGAETLPIALEPEPQNGDEHDKTSRFKGTLPETLQGQPVEVTIPNMRINGERFRLGFPSVIPTSHASDAMPQSLGDDESRKLFLTAGGKYTAADIAANGNQTGNQKFRGFVPKHDLKPKTGDKICPITLTKANPNCSWIVDGKTYEFCCPPCVEEFVKLAKEQPAEIKEPGEYVKR